MGRDTATPAAVTTVLALMLCGSELAHAKAGDHIRTGNTTIIPSMELAVVTRSNVYLVEGASTNEAGEAVGADPERGTLFRVHPGLMFNVKGNDAIFDFSADYKAVKFFEKSHTNLDRYKDVQLGASLKAFPESVVGFKLNDRFHITGRESEASYATSSYINHTMNDAGGRVSIHPGSALEIDLGGNVTYDKYDVSPQSTAEGSPALNNRLGYGPGLDLKWNFFPKTAVVASYSMAWFDWEENVVDARGDGISTEDVGETLGIPDGSLWRTSLGLRGRLTDKVVVGVIAGYGQMDYDEGSVKGADGNAAGFAEDLKGLPDGLTGVVELGLKPNKSQSITIGYRKAFQDVYFTNFVSFHNGFLRYEGTFAERVGVTFNTGYRYETYGGEISREDHLLNAGGDVVFKTTAFLDVGLGVGWVQRGSADGAHPEIEYDDVNIRGGLTFTY